MTELIQFLLFSGHLVWACEIDLILGSLVEAVRRLRLICSSRLRKGRTHTEMPDSSA